MTKVIKEKNSDTVFIDTRAGETKVVQMSKDKAKDLKTDTNITGIETSRGERIKEEENPLGGNIKPSKEVSKNIARKVAKVLINALRGVGEEIHSGKIKNISEGSFDIDISYKSGVSEDIFSFSIGPNNDLYVDLGAEINLGNIKVLPSGKTILNEVEIEDKLTKAFTNIQETSFEAGEDNYKEKENLKKAGPLLSRLEDLFKTYNKDYEKGDFKAFKTGTASREEQFKIIKTLTGLGYEEEVNKLKDQYGVEIPNNPQPVELEEPINIGRFSVMPNHGSNTYRVVKISRVNPGEEFPIKDNIESKEEAIALAKTKEAARIEKEKDLVEIQSDNYYIIRIDPEGVKHIYTKNEKPVVLRDKGQADKFLELYGKVKKKSPVTDKHHYKVVGPGEEDYDWVQSKLNLMNENHLEVEVPIENNIHDLLYKITVDSARSCKLLKANPEFILNEDDMDRFSYIQECLSSFYERLEYETKQPAIDQLALEGKSK